MAAISASADDAWTTFVNDTTQRQGASYCAEMNLETGQFFCVEIACAPGAPLAMEFSHQAGRWEDVLMTEFRINGRSMGRYDFTRVEGSGYALYTSQEAATDMQLQAMLRNGVTAEIAIGSRVIELSLSGSSRAIREATAACTY